MTKIIVDSGCELTEEMKSYAGISFESAPLTLEVDGKVYIDDENLAINDYINSLENSIGLAKTAAISPDKFLGGFKDDCDQVFVVTLSSRLSSTYSNALIAKQMYLDEVGDKLIHVFDSLSASVGETVAALKIIEFVQKGLSYQEIVEKVTEFIKSARTFFLLDKLDNLIKGGRIDPLMGKIASILTIKLICTGVDGVIDLYAKARGYKNGLKKLVDIIVNDKVDFENRILAISHCRALIRANELKDEVLKRVKFKDVIIVEMRGLSSTYATVGGIVVSY